jgi:hypothetical protein
MAFWLRPGERSGEHLAKNTTRLSNHLLTKRIAIGHHDMPNVIRYDVTFTLPIGEKHTFAQFEAVTGYMPAVFETFHTIDQEGRLNPLSDGPGEQAKPVVFSTTDGSHAMGIWSPDQPSPGYETAGYGRWRFKAQKVVKWNCVFRVRNHDGVPAADYTFHSYVVLGTLNDVLQTITRLRSL